MTHVKLVGPGEGGRNLVVEAADGARFSLPVTDELKALVTHVEAADGTRVPVLPPREIQRRLRAGFTAERLSELSGVPVEGIRRYEAPIVAERAFIAELARAAPVRREPGSPVLGDLVMDRLASRGIPGASITWDAWRPAGEPWRVGLAYEKGGTTVQAVWTFDHQLRTVIAEDAESRSLTETDVPTAPSTPRHLAAVGRPVAPSPTEPAAPPEPETPEAFDGEADTATPEGAEGNPEEDGDLLDRLQAKRGVREAVRESSEEAEEDDEFEGFGPQLREAEVGFAAGGASPRARTRRGGRTGRAPMPKWDEIVFGTSTDES